MGTTTKQPTSHYLVQLKPNVVEYGWLVMHNPTALSFGSKVNDSLTNQISFFEHRQVDLKSLRPWRMGEREERKSGDLLCLLLTTDFGFA